MWGHAVFERAHKVTVDDHCFVIALVGKLHLLNETFILVDRVVKFRIGVGEFLAVDHQFEAFGKFGVLAVFLGQRRHLDGVVDDESGLYVATFTLLAEDFVDEFAFAHSLVYFDAERGGSFSELLFGHAGDVYSGVLLDGIGHGDAAEGGLEADHVVANLDLCGAVDFETDGLNEFSVNSIIQL